MVLDMNAAGLNGMIEGVIVMPDFVYAAPAQNVPDESVNIRGSSSQTNVGVTGTIDNT